MSPKSTKSRMFLVEPTFVLKVGHVSQCTKLFASQAEAYGYEVVIVVPKCAPTGTPVELEFNLLRALPNTYETFLVEGMRYRYKFQKIVSLLSKILPKARGDRGKFFLERVHWFNHFSRATMKTWESLDEIYKFNNRDRFILPNADHLTTRSLIKYLKQKKNQESPSVGLRFINVMENNAIPRFIKPNSLFKFLETSKNHGIKISVAAETEGYRAFIGQFVTDTFICEYPQNHGVKPRSSSSFSKRNFTLGSLGSARPDKGFTKLKGLVTRILAAHGSKVKVVIQEGLTSWNTEYDLTLSELRSYPQVTFLPGYLTQKEMQNAVNECDILLMPYDEPTYEFRGSAMLFEAADLQIPILVPSRTGLGEVVRKYGIGATYTSESDLNRALEVILALDSRILVGRFQEYNSQRQKNFKKLLIG